MWLPSPPSPWTRIAGSDLTWKQAVIWGVSTVHRDCVNFNQAAWANAVIWGVDNVGVTDGDAMIWAVTGGLSPDTTAWGDLHEATGGTSGTTTGYSIRP